MLGAEKGRPGGVYFVTDGEPVVFRDFITELLGTQGVEVPDRKHAGAGRAGRRRRCRGGLANASGSRADPPVTRLAFWLSSLECTIDISRARVGARLRAGAHDRGRHGGAAPGARHRGLRAVSAQRLPKPWRQLG